MSARANRKLVAGTATLAPEMVKFVGASVVEDEAPALIAAPRDERLRQMAWGVCRYQAGDEPLVMLSLVLGEDQLTATFTPDQLDQFCHTIADAVLWQNDQLRQRGEKAVH